MKALAKVAVAVLLLASTPTSSDAADEQVVGTKDACEFLRQQIVGVYTTFMLCRPTANAAYNAAPLCESKLEINTEFLGLYRKLHEGVGCDSEEMVNAILQAHGLVIERKLKQSENQ